MNKFKEERKDSMQMGGTVGLFACYLSDRKIPLKGTVTLVRTVTDKDNLRMYTGWELKRIGICPRVQKYNGKNDEPTRTQAQYTCHLLYVAIS